MQQADFSDLISIAEVEARADAFERVLREHEISIQCGSALEHGLLLLHEMRHRHENTSKQAASRTMSYDVQEAMGIFHFVQLVIRNAANREFFKLVSHLKQLNKGEVALTKRSRVTDQTSNKLFELAVALAVMEHGTELQIDEPVRSSGGTNPDVLARMADNLLWGFACKVSHGASSQTLFDLIIHGIEQIERSPADKGIVIVSFKNKIPHEHLLPILEIDAAGMPVLGVHANLNQVVQLMRDFVVQSVETMVNEVGRGAIWEKIRSRKALPGVLVHVLAGVGIQTQLGVAPAPIGFFELVRFEYSQLIVPTRFDATTRGVLEDVNRGLRVL
jgi:hypothetical protein